MSSLIVRNGHYYLSWYVGSKKMRKSLKTTVKRIALDAKTIHDNRVLNRELGVTIKSDVSIVKLIDRYVEHRKLRRAAAETIASYVRCKKAIESVLIEGMGETRADDVTGKVVEHYIDLRLGSGVREGTAAQEMIFLRSAIKWAVRTQVIPMSADWSSQWPPLRNSTDCSDPRNQHYRRDEVERMMVAAKGTAFEPTFLVSLHTGARFSECMKMLVEDVDQDVIRIYSKKTDRKTGIPFRMVEVHPNIVGLIATLIEGKQPSDHLFAEATMVSREWWRKEMLKLCKRAGVVYRRFHGLRHTFATFYMASGADIREVMDATGHVTMASVERYIHSSGIRSRGKIAKLSFTDPFGEKKDPASATG